LALMQIRMLGDPVLRERARPVDTFDAALQRLAEDMFETMYDAPGVGLAAPQVGLAIRLFVFDDHEGARGVVANAEVSGHEGETTMDEGCLSVPGLYYPTARAERVRLRGQDAAGRPVDLRAEGFLARIFQHETDHLDGMLYLERLRPEDRRAAMAEMRARELGPAGARHGGRSRPSPR
jgi:peptide deformylase